jgi:hypothetical protein
MNEMTRAAFLEVARSLPLAHDIGDIDKNLWQPFWRSLHGVKGIFCLTDPKYEKDYLPPTTDFAGRCHLFSFLQSNRLGLIQNIGSEKPFRYTYTISFDTNYASYLAAHYESRDLGDNEAAFLASLRFLLDYESGLDCQCYLFENYDKLGSEECRRTVQAYLAFRHADRPTLLSKNSISPTITSAEMARRVASIIKMAQGKDFGTLYERARHNYLAAAVCLHKMAEIAIRGPSSPKQQLLTFLRYLHETLAFFPLRELFLAFSCFTMRPRPNFFDPVQKNSMTLLRRLNAMSWDVSHLRTLLDFSAASSRGHGAAAFPVPYFLTFDRSLAALKPLIQGKALIYFNSPNRAEIVHSYAHVDKMDEVLGKDAEQFFGQDAFMSRQKRRPPDDSDWTPFMQDQLRIIQTSVNELLRK